MASYKFSKTAKLLAVGSFARGTQNEAFVNPAIVQNGQLAFGLPRTSLGGVVVTGLASAKFTAKHGKWEFIGDFRFDDRDNQTPSASICSRMTASQRAALRRFLASTDCPAGWEATPISTTTGPSARRPTRSTPRPNMRCRDRNISRLDTLGKN